MNEPERYHPEVPDDPSRTADEFTLESDFPTPDDFERASRLNERINDEAFWESWL